MNIPDKVNIGGLNYNVIITEYIKQGLDVYGEIFATDLEIRLRKSVAPERLNFALIHEVFHGIMDNLGYIDDTTYDEQFVHRVSAAIYQFIIDNPKVFETNKTERQ